MNKKDLVKALSKAIGSENVLSSPPDLVAYSYDALNKRFLPDLIVFAQSTAEVSAIMKIAHRERVPVVVRGAGTNLTGGTVATQGGIVLELSRLNRILDIDTARQRVVVEPGVINLELQNILQPLGFVYAPDPASQKTSTLGGNLGEDAGGPHCLKYGVTHNHIVGLELVLADGQVIQVGTSADDSYGYDLLGPLVGSEGTLGIATKLILRIIHLPESFQTMLVTFETLEAAGQAVSDIIAAGIVPAALEMMDNPMIRAVEASVHAGYPVDAEALLLIELDVLKEALERQGKQIVEICRANNVQEIKTARTAAEREVLWSGRRGAFGAIARVTPAYSVQDVTVPRNKLMLMLREISKIAEKYKLPIGNVAHAGDGNLHPLVMFDNRNPEESHRAHQAGKEILSTCVAIGGTISGEHGIGIEKQDSMPLMFNSGELELMRRVKRVFDPEDILNPGKLLPPEETITEPVASKTTNGKGLHDELAEILGTDSILSNPDEMAAYQIDDMPPSLVVFPSHTEHISQIIRVANRNGISIVPWGNGSKQNISFPLASTGIILCLKKLNRLLELDAPNLTAAVEAGMNHAGLQKELTRQGLRFPLQPEDMESATVGGSLATNSSGPKRLLHGTARDRVLGVTVVTPLGEVIHAGIKTMKNVAGYDLRKLFFGSWGTLGIITEAVLKLSYLPEAHKTLLLGFLDIASIIQIVRNIMDSPLTPEAMELIDAEAAHSLGKDSDFKLKQGEILLLIRVAGSHEEVERHIRDIQALAKTNNAQSADVLSGREEEKIWDDQRQIKLYSVPGMTKGKAVVPIDKAGDMYQEIKKAVAGHQLKVSITGRAGNGILYASLFPEEKDTRNIKLLAAIADLVKSAAGLGGFFLVKSGSPEIRQT
ncbi:FAD-binding oxidoreductase, partial [Chloroflexota bacterium]